MVGCRPPYPWLEAPSDVERIAASPPDDPCETLFRHKEGHLIPVAVKRFRIPGANGEPVAVVGLISDLSEQRRFEQQLAQSGKLATIGELAAGRRTRDQQPTLRDPRARRVPPEGSRAWHEGPRPARPRSPDRARDQRDRPRAPRLRARAERGTRARERGGRGARDRRALPADERGKGDRRRGGLLRRRPRRSSAARTS